MSDPTQLSFDLEEMLEEVPEVPTPEPVAPAPSEDARSVALQEALKISERARLELLDRMAAPREQPQPVQPGYTRERLAELLSSDDPNERLFAVETMQQQAIAQIAPAFTSRIEQLTHNNIASAKSDAERRFPAEFELFRDQIEGFQNQLPDKSALTNAAGWDSLITYVRGQSQNFDRLVEHRAAASNNGAIARSAQKSVVGQSFRPTGGGVVGGGETLDQDSRDIARNLIAAGIYKNEAEYIKDMRAFNG